MLYCLQLKFKEQIQVQIKTFNQLTNNELYHILKLRYAIFVVEQQSIYNEYDDKDLEAYHVYYQADTNIIAYARIYQKSKNTTILGRVLVADNYRKEGIGKKIIQESLRFIHNKFPNSQIEIGAQYHLKSYYESFGFTQSSDLYDDGGIDHIEMLLKNN